MKSESFCYWVQGYFELHGPGPLTAKQVSVIKKHLDLVFLHEIDPSQAEPAPKTKHQQKLDEAHGKTKPATAAWLAEEHGFHPHGGHGDLVLRC